MSKLEELLNKECPDGVEYVPLWSVTIWDKKFNSVDRKKQPEVINYPYLLASDLFAMEQDSGDVFLLSTGEKTGWTTEKIAANNLCNGEVVTIPWGKSRAVIDCIKYYKGKFVTADNRIMTSNDKKKLDNKFLYYIIISKGKLIDTFYRGSGIKHPDMSRVLDIIIPLPPIEVQKEIVRILDEFTEKTNKLQELLHRETILRKKQYEYYRDKLLTFNDDIEWKNLSEIAEIGTGSSNTNEEIENGKYPFFVRSQEVRSKNEYEYDETAIITSGDGVGVGKIFHYIEGKYALHQRAYRIHIIDENVIPKYYFYYMKTTFLSYIEKTSFHSSVTSIRRPMLDNYPVPVPPLEEQERIVNILDKFDALCNDITRGLPAEIELRKKQYEYYRDKLLTFKEKKK
ncbi:restriction endonuclease subunit S [Brachyspira pilosicoli]|uniref:Restriction endonuclease subunit S n=1 Tax=Brachyspira pilosicoli TaxID=52584 RepID=A0AAJ6GCC3_BRAPL|nr:restriction endonuclease subunit S [Brachyspira pilosicoli]WIH89825.1 restriction endonuclease subunit S [Brachyspira pilosicoli]WIH92120.1 restriction endonuclease subunit S [Brachyspira pilosicoli]WIH94349.1 restriction endonuclease subunit S [Brachyspira pilosicoli]